jgi:tyrosinase
MAKKKTTTQSRYDKVKEILQAAGGGSAADYGGIGPFWKLPWERLLDSNLYGLPLIASESESTKSCCSIPRDAAPRSARSALIQGLRGESPFDGSRFPQIPWGGRPVPEADIQFIADWIDAGCPRTELEVALVAIAEKPPVRIQLIAPAPATDAEDENPNEYLFERGELKQRMNIDCMSDLQVEKFRFAMRELYELNKWAEDSRSYNNLALIHQNHCQHGWERFLPWHRVYLYEFEQALQDHCPDVTVPYWDWTMQQYVPHAPETGDVIPRAYKAVLRAQSLKYLEDHDFPEPAIKGLSKDIVGNLYTSPRLFFAAVSKSIGPVYTKGVHRNRLIDALLDANSLWYPLRYPAEYQDASGNPLKINQRIHYHYPTAEDIEQIMSVNTFRDFGGGSGYDDAFGFMDQNPHNTLHIWTGGMNPDAAKSSPPADRNKAVQVAGRRFHSRDDLYTQPDFGDMFSNLTASYDPVFWPVHANVDRLWWEWQQTHPNSNPVELDAILTPWSYTIQDTLDMHRFGYEYVKSTFVTPVGVSAPVGKFVSKSIALPAAVKSSFDRAEVRLHRIPQLPRSCFVRVFLNLPDADASTPLDHPNYAGYLAIFGHGGCYGGPGHCDPPPPRARKYDLRPRSHNTPRNHRVNVTKCAQRLIKGGASSLRITLVVIGADYQEDKDLLRLEGVSLNFLD